MATRIKLGLNSRDRNVASSRNQTKQRKQPAQVGSRKPSNASVPVGNLALQRLLRGRSIQAKLTVNQPGDRYEQEADRVADQVMRMPTAGAPPRIQRACAGCEDELRRQAAEEEEEEEMLQAKERPGSTPHVGPGVAARIDSLRGRGGPLPTSERAFFEARFGRDFGNVRVHTDANAAEAARAVNARAFTMGRDVVFGRGAFAPGTRAGRTLLAHELTHVVQQSSTRDNPNSVPFRDRPGSLAHPNNRLLQRARSYSDCSTSDEAAIEAAAVQAQTDLDTAITALNTRPLTTQVSNALFLAFRSNSVSTADSVKQKLQAIRNGVPNVSFECEHPGSVLYGHFCPPQRYGYVRHVGWVIHMCMSKFLTMAANSQSRAIVHESSHFFTSTSDEGYLTFPDCQETGQTAGDPPADRLDNADSYACLVHYLAHGTAANIAGRAQAYEGGNLTMSQSTPGPINLSSGVPKDPLFEIRGVPSDSGFVFRWVIDVNGDRYRMWSDDGNVFHYSAATTAYIPSGTRALMSSRGITSGKILCRVRLWRPSLFGSDPPTILIEKPVTFTP